MRPFAFIADVHVGNHRQHGGAMVCGLNDRARRILTVLHAVVRDLPADETLVILGDLLDASRPPPQLIAAVMDALLPLRERCVLLAGNHDVDSPEPGDSGLAPFRSAGFCVVDEPALIDGLLCLPHSRQPGISYVTETAARFPGAKALAMHLGVFDAPQASAAPWMRQCEDAVSAEALRRVLEPQGFGHVFAGNWHDERSWYDGRHFDAWDAPDRAPVNFKIVQVGALVPTGWNNPGLSYGQVVHLREGKISRQFFHGPRFLEVTSLQQIGSLPPASLFVRAVLPPDAHEQARRALAALGLAGWEVIASAKEARAASVAAASAAASAASLDAAIAEVCAKLPLPEGCRRAGVELLVRRAFRETAGQP